MENQATVFGKADCEICQAATQKLTLLGIPNDKEEINRFLVPHEGWRTDGSAEIMSAYDMFDQKLPVIRLNGEFFDYPGAMRRAKEVAGVRDS